MKKGGLCLFVLGLLCGGFLLLRQEPSAAVAEPQHTLRVVLWDYGVVSYDQKIVEAFEELHPEIAIEIISYPPLYYNSSLKALLDSDERVDIIFINQLDQFNQVTSRDIALPLDEFVQRDQINLQAYPYVDVLRDDNGSLLALPYRKDKLLLYYNKDMFEQATMALPSAMTWEQFAQTAVDLTNTLDEGQYGAFFLKNDVRLPKIMEDIPFDWYDGDYSMVIRGLEYYKRLEQEGSIPLLSFCESQSPSQRIIQTGNYGMFIHGTWYLNYLKTDQDQGKFDIAWGVAPKPVWTLDMATQNPTQLTPLCIHKDTPEPEAAWTFLKFVCGKEGASIMAEELMLPAYEDTDIRAKLEETLSAYGVEPSLVLDDFSPPLAPLSLEEQSRMDLVYQEYGDALIGLCTPEEAVLEMKKILLS